MNRSLLLLALAATLTQGCALRYWKAGFQEPGPLTTDAPFVKLHLVDGSVAVYGAKWTQTDAVFSGFGILYDDQRAVVKRGEVRVPMSAVALIETNTPAKVNDPSVALMGVATGASLAATGICVSTPKACFGSCPTFYTQTPDGVALQAEGFSAAVSPALEHADTDALFTAVATTGGPLTLSLTNEALETHHIRTVEVLAVPRSASGRAWRSGDRYFAGSETVPPTSCESDTGPCLDAVLAVDDASWISPSDPEDLAAPANLVVTLPPPPTTGANKGGVVVAARQGLVTTFVFYQALDWMGPSAGRLQAAVANGSTDTAERLNAASALLAQLHVQAQTPDGWVDIGTFREVGPIAREVEVFALPDNAVEPVQVRLSGAAGSWRIDHIGRVSLDRPVRPVVLPISAVQDADGEPQTQVLERFLDPERFVVNNPGTRYDLVFDVPKTEQGWELFVRSQGYYTEWMREPWMQDSNPMALARLIRHPERSLRDLAAPYKALEPDAERLFWASRVELERPPTSDSTQVGTP
ncbi:MAG: hypothetical protein AB8H79_00380 [Myxococcota bacterium]